MISKSEYKRLLGKEAESLSEEEIRLLQDAHYAWAHVAWQIWKQKQEWLDKKS